jgi:hypothetical protein
MMISNNSIDEVAEEVQEVQDSPLDGDLDEAPSFTSNIDTTALDQPAPTTPTEQTGNIPAITSSTPPVLKLAGSQTYTSSVLNRPDLNTALAKEMDQRFLGAMRPEDFLDEYLPLNSAQLPNFSAESEEGMRFAALAGARPETQMCKKFVSF